VQTAHQGPAVLGLALLAMAEDLGSHMANRALEHLLQYGDMPVRYVLPTFSTSL
jgi:26S proteasome regulatory subunit N1